MNLTTILGAISGLALSFAIGAYMGSQWNEAKHTRAEVKVLQSDAKVLPKIEADNAKAKERIVTVIKTIREESKPTDCLNQRMPDDVLGQLRKPGST